MNNKNTVPIKPAFLRIEQLRPFEGHPYKVQDNEEMAALSESVRENGVLSPLIVRSVENSNEYEVISGHRRLYAAQKVSLTELPVLICAPDRDSAAIAVVDSNLHREHILPSEKAYAYKLKMEALSHQGIACGQVGHKSRDAVSNDDSGRTIQRYIRLTELVPELLELVDDGRMAFRPAVEISYLTEDEQRDLVETIDSEDCTPSLSQACRMKKLSQEGRLDMDAIFAIMTEEKANQKEKIKIPAERLDRFFERGTPQAEIEKVIIAALEDYYARIRQSRANRDAR